MRGREHDRSELKRQVLADLERARGELVRHSGRASVQLSPAALAQRSFQKHRIVWIAGALVAGALVVRLVIAPPRNKNERDNPSKSGTKGTLLRMITDSVLAAGRKAAVTMATRYFQNQFKQQFQASAPGEDEIA